MLIEHINIPQRPDRDRTGTVGASELAKCARMVGYSRSGTPRDAEDETSGFAERGHWIEKWWVERLRESPIGSQIKRAGDFQETIHYGPLSATPDGIYQGAYAADCKSFDPRIYDIPKPEHIVQVRLTAKLAQVSGAILTYINASDFGDKREFIYEAASDDELASAIKRAHRILSSDPNSLPREGWIAGAKECKECPFKTACVGEKIETVIDLDDATAARVLVLRETAKDAKQREKAAGKEAKAALEEILQTLKAAGTRRAKGLAYIKRSNGKSSLDFEAMEADGIDLSPYRREGKPYESVILEKESVK